MSKSNIHKRVMKSALVVSYVSYLTFSAINAQENQSISIYNTTWFQVDTEQGAFAIRCVYDADMTLQQTEYYSNSTIGEQQTDHMALEHCYREYCTERNDNYYFTVLPTYGFAHAKISEFNLHIVSILKFIFM